MKLFWSWQADTPGNIGRHFVRDTLAEAVEVLKQPETVEEPSEAERRAMLHLDHDRKNVPGTPDLAPTILKKIEQSTVFIGDVTLVGRPLANASGAKGAKAKRFINSNVGIEYGYALHALTDAAILMVQNVHYGDRDRLPFDLQHKAGPIQYRLAPGASKEEIAAAKARLRGDLVTALRLYVAAATTSAPVFAEMPPKSGPAFFFDPMDKLAEIGEPGVDEIEYRYQEQRAFYLRLIPALDAKLKMAELTARVQGHAVQTLSNTFGGIQRRNGHGIISCNPRGGTSDALVSLTQVFRNGELWGITSELLVLYLGRDTIPVGKLESVYRRVLANFLSIAEEALGLAAPFTIEFGATGLRDVWLGLGQHDLRGPIHDDQVVVRRVLNGTSPAAQAKVLGDFVAELFDRAGEARAA
jgi:hypothetical protein